MQVLLLLATLALGAQKAAPARPAGSTAAASAAKAPVLKSLPNLPKTVIAAAVQTAFEAKAAPATVLGAVKKLDKGLSSDLAPSGGGGEAASGRLQAEFQGGRLDAPASETLVAGQPAASPRTVLGRAAAKARSVAGKVPAMAREMIGGPETPALLVALAFVWNSLTIMSYSMFAPVKATLANFKAGPEQMPIIYMWCAAATLGVVLIYNALAKRFSRRAMVGGALVGLVGTYAAWAAFIRFGEIGPTTAKALFAWNDVFGVMALTVFWSFVNDTFKAGWRKSFGLITAGAALGGVFGSLVPALLVKQLGLENVAVIAAITYAPVLALFAWMSKLAPPAQAAASAAEATPLWTAFKSERLLGLLAAVVFFERFVSDVSFYLFNIVAKGHFASGLEFAQWAAWFQVGQNGISFLISFAFAWVAKTKYGLGVALAGAFAINLVGLVGFPLLPVFGFVVGYNLLEGLMRYSWFKSAKEIVWSEVDRGVLFRAKAMIEMFDYRLARGVAGAVIFALAQLGGTTAVVWGLAPVALAAVGVAIWLAAEIRRRQPAASDPAR